MTTEIATRDATKPMAGIQGGKYLTFGLGAVEFGLEILAVREIMKLINITAIPRVPSYVRGVFNLRGQVIAVVDLRAKFGMEAVPATDQTCIIMVEVAHDGQKLSTGIIVDRVSEVLEIPGSSIEKPPEFGSDVAENFILGMGKVGDKVKILLDISKVLNSAEVARIVAAA